jgi:single-strand DNA-binding protein
MNDLLTQLIQCNQWRFIGRLAADPELRCFQSGASVCNARLLVNKPGQKRDDGQKPYSFKLELWNDKAQQFVDAAGKGDLIDVDGRVKTESWDDRTTGEKRHGVVMNVESFEVLAKPGATTQASPATSAWAGAAPAAAPPARPATPTSPPVWGSSAGDDNSDVPF